MGTIFMFCACIGLTAGTLLSWDQGRSLAWSLSSRGQLTLASPQVHSLIEPDPQSPAQPRPASERTDLLTQGLTPVAPTPSATTSDPPTPTAPPTYPTVEPAVALLATPSATETVAQATPPRPPTFNLLLLGSDRDQPGKGTWRTDVIVLVSIDLKSGVAGALAIPRDLYVNIPGHEPDRINTVDFLGHYTKYPGGGPALLNRTLQENFGFGFDRYIRVDFAGFVKIVDIFGGIDVDVDCPLEEWFADPTLPGGRLLKVSAGLQHFDGITALLFVRQRHDNGDTDRSRRQFKVLMALREKALKIDSLPLIPKLWASYRESVQTDLSLTEAFELARWGTSLEPENIRGAIIDQTIATPWTTPKGAWVMLPDRAKIHALYESLLDAPSLIEAGQRTRCPKRNTAQS